MRLHGAPMDETPSRKSMPAADHALGALSPAGEDESGAARSALDWVADRIVMIRGRRAMLDVDLATLYGVSPKRLNEQVKRNRARFPEDFLFQLTLKEARALPLSRSQFATLKRGHNLKYAPFAFTEHGAVMLAAVLNSSVAVEASIQVVRAFVHLRAMVAVHVELAQKLDALEHKFDQQFRVVFEAIRQLMAPSSGPQKPQIGFRSPADSFPSGDAR
jgi:hypothetical protein